MASGQPTVAALKGRPIGRILIKMGKVTRAQVSRALELQKSKKKGLPLGELLIEMGDVTKEDVNIALAAQVGWESIRIGEIDIERNVIDMKLLNLVLLQAIRDKASDIHFEPFETSSRCGTASTACSTRWCRRRSTSGRRSRAA
jgi:type II secretory ATPase GspE/PulE/Tfp pilus assembly ATPase PilB-like protein